MEDSIPITVERLRNCGWEAAVVDEPESYHAQAFAFRKQANAADAAGDAPRARMLEVLALICSLGFEPTNRGQPFQSFMVTQEGRTFMPDDLDASQLAVLVEFGAEITNGPLQARLADLGWVYLRPRNQVHALRAMDAYTSKPIDQQSWFGTGERNWKRAVMLCREIKKAAREKLASIEKRSLEVVLGDQGASAPLRRSVAEFLRESGLGKDAKPQVAERLEQDARDYLAKGDPLSAREPLKEAGIWYQKAALEEASARTTSGVADTLIAEGALFEANATNGALAASSFFRDALEHLQQIPRKYRQSLRVDERIRELRQRITECNERGLEQMQSYESKPFDITRFVAEAQAWVAGKSAVEALAAFVRLVPTMPASHWLDQAAEVARKYPLSTLFPGYQLSDDGRITSKSPGVDPSKPDSPEWRSLIERRAVSDLARYMLMCVKGGILPALGTLHTEHRLTERDFIVLASHSPIVPDDRAVTVGRGLCAGFNYDFAIAVHLLTPQLEHIVRGHLRATRAQTRHMASDDGVENEVGLSKLMDLPEATRVFGNLAFEIRTLFCEPTGFNLRNTLAHGLLNDAKLHNDELVFAWWFCLKLVMLPLIKSNARVESEADGESSTDGGQPRQPPSPDADRSDLPAIADG